MKKIALILVALLVAGFAFGEMVATVDGSATLTWGVDLGTGATGFTNAASATLDLELVPKSTEMMDGDALYGYISLKDFKVLIEEGDKLTATAPSVSAKLILSPEAYLMVYGAPKDATGVVKSFTYLSESNKDAETNAVAPDLGTTGGFAVNYDFGMGDVTVGVMSHGAWDVTGAVTAADAVYDWVDGDNDPTTDPTWGIATAAVAADPGTSNTANDYSASVFVNLAPADMVSLGLGVVYGELAAADLGLQFTADITPADMLAIGIGFDGALPSGGAFDFEADVDVDVTLDAASLGVYFYYGAIAESQITLGITAVENLAFDVTAELYDILGTLDYAAKVALSYTIDTIKPYATVKLNADDTIGAKAGVEVALAPNTTFDVNYDAADVSAAGDVEASLKIAY